MVSGRSGMGSHKHGISGYAGKSARFRANAKREAEKNDVKKVKIDNPKDSVKDLMLMHYGLKRKK